MNKRRGLIGARFAVYTTGLLIMALGIVLLIKSSLGATAWDVLHVGLYYQLGLTIGSWSVIAGLFILSLSTIISKEFPKFGAFLNMVLVGLFIDLYMLLPFMQTPGSFAGKASMFVIGTILMGYGMGIYISAQFGAGPRDSLMIALASKRKWKIRNVRAGMELVVLLIGWRLGGPVFWGTVVFSMTIGPIAGLAIPQCQKLTDKVLKHVHNKKELLKGNQGEETKRGAVL
ncbi:YczE/YyaS/YitT family protein [Mesobacillus harenae]|uniref:YczE/YyaS/YitT family protein n=1 Tax=Mesobacillus harenae TaxID=2213203 RepID=UPI0015806FA2|nr:YitT family protein [Mesobacillus harenae]